MAAAWDLPAVQLPTPALHIQLLGPFQLRYGDEVATDLDQARLQSLLAYLVLQCAAPQPRQRLAFLFWPDSSERQAFNNLRKALHSLRKAVPALAEFLQIENKTVQWRADAPLLLDVAQFEQHLSTASQAADAVQVRRHLETAVGLYAGDLLPNCYDDWVGPERERLRERFLEALTQLSDELEQARAYPAAIRQATRLLRTDPLHEQTYRRLMRLYMLQGDRAAALRTYHICATTLQQELGVAPGADIQQAYNHLLRLELPAAVPPHPPGAPLRHVGLVGRKPEWQELLFTWQRTVAGQAQLMLIAGEAGIGKTRLAEELLWWAGHQGVATSRTRAYAAEGSLAYAPVTEWLRSEAVRPGWASLDPVWLGELARLLPELLVAQPNLPRPEPLRESWQRQRLLEALSHAILAVPSPLLLLFDDLQWCDRETLEWLHYLLRFDPTARLLVVGTLRPEEVDYRHPLAALVGQLRSNDQVSQIELGALSAAETAALAEQVAAQPLAGELAQLLYRTTEGNPLFVTETVRATLAAEGASAGEGLSSTFQISTTFLPPKLQAVIHQRLDALSPDARELVSLAAVIGRSFTFPVLARASGLDEDTLVRGLDELWQRRIVRELQAEAYDFSHDRLRDVAYAAVSLTRRRLLHRRVAEALEAVHAGDLDGVSAQLAAQAEQAGMVDKAVTYYRRAAATARAVYAFGDVIGYLSKAQDLLKTLPATPERAEQELDICVALGAAWSSVKTCAAVEAKQAYERAFQLSSHIDLSPRLLNALWGLHEYHLQRAEYARSLETAEQCLRIAEKLQDPALLLEAHHAMWGSLTWTNQYAAAVEHIDRGLALYDRQRHHVLTFDYGTHDAGHCGLATAGIALWISGYVDQARQRLEEAIRLTQELSIPLSQADACYNNALVHQLFGEPDAVRRWADAAVALAQPRGYRYCHAIASVLAGWARAMQGDFEAGCILLREGMAAWNAEGVKFTQTYNYALLVEAYLAADQLDNALSTLLEGQDFAKEVGEHFYEPELYRLHGELLQLQGAAPQQVAGQYSQALSLARQQGAKSLELRAALGLARIWVTQGRRQAAHDLLAGVYGWFTEGFDTPDLQEAQALLTALAA